jgi:hypothetical protein
MKAVTLDQLRASYHELYPEEADCDWLDPWLAVYSNAPMEALAACTSYKGKATRALFHALKLSWPATKRGIVVALI